MEVLKLRGESQVNLRQPRMYLHKCNALILYALRVCLIEVFGFGKKKKHGLLVIHGLGFSGSLKFVQFLKD